MNRVFELREWQQEAFRKIKECKKNDFLCVATPGAGKTKFALRVAYDFLNSGRADRIVIVTPTEGLKRQWAETAASFAGLDIDPDFSNSQIREAADYKGIAITYALLGMDKSGIHQQRTNSTRTFVIFDEVHHAGDNLTWGNAVKNSFSQAIFRLAISGTAFRSDDNPIPFITYNERRMSQADYSYTYERSVIENVCRPVFFSAYNGVMKWRVDTQEFEQTFDDNLTPDQVSKRLKTALEPKGNWVRSVLIAADQKLMEIRRTSHQNAAGLIFCMTQKHAREIAKVLKTITGASSPVIVSETGTGSDEIERFRNSSDKWIVSVKMVSEGVDIPRLRVGVYLTNVKAELFFRQAVGRFVRVLSDLQSQDAFIFIPQDREIVKLAETIQEEREHALDECDSGSDRSDRDLFGSYIPALTGRFIPIQSDVTDGKMIRSSISISSGAEHSRDNRITPDSPIYLQKNFLREQMNQIAKRYALRFNNGCKPDFKILHKRWIEAGGKNMELETVDELRKRLAFYQNMLRQVA